MRYMVSKSNEKFISKIKCPEDDRIIAIGGGATIDKAKMVDPDKAIYAVPTTASGAAMTSRAVKWNKDSKETVWTQRPILIEAYRYLPIELSEDTIDATFWDAVGHIKDSRNSKYATQESLCHCEIAELYLQKFLNSRNVVDLIEGGNSAGRAIEITGTNFYHAISYVLTLDYGLSHGKAVKEAILMQEGFDWNKIFRKARQYDKFTDIFP